MRDGKLDDYDNRQAVLQALAVGMTLADAAECAGVSARMLSKYRARNPGFDAACVAARGVSTALAGPVEPDQPDDAEPVEPAQEPDATNEPEAPARPIEAEPPPVRERPVRPPKRPRAPSLPDLPILARNPWMRSIIRELDSLGGPSLREILEMTEEIARDGKHRAAGNALDKLWEIKFGPLMWEVRRVLEAGGPPIDTPLPDVVDGEIVPEAPDTRRASGLVILRVPKNGREAPGRGPQDEPEAEPETVDLAGDGR